eukprot:COSAG05_NODE_9_length_39734_cov_180.598067_21_plen_72_part_00
MLLAALDDLCSVVVHAVAVMIAHDDLQAARHGCVRTELPLAALFHEEVRYLVFQPLRVQFMDDGFSGVART